VHDDYLFSQRICSPPELLRHKLVQGKEVSETDTIPRGSRSTTVEIQTGGLLGATRLFLAGSTSIFHFETVDGIETSNTIDALAMTSCCLGTG
jgi:hypothetical protein